ncbi:MAG: FtsW/RodA/SpoVE family cell cycle protein [Bacillota bacterium]|nr:FtsW/RodA/SpoVE family cell cycle protein [Bacillota bacterium]
MIKKILKSYDYTLVIAIALLATFGLIMVYSASMVTAMQRYGYPADYFYQKQKLHLIAAAVVFILTALFPYKAMRSTRILFPMVVGSLAGLAALFVFGHVAGNANSWFKFGSNSLQPSEFVKLFVIIYMSAVYAKKQNYINEFNKGVVPPLLYLFLVCLFVAIQPDFGTAGIIFLIALTVIVSSGMNGKNILRLATIGIIAALPFAIVLKAKVFSTVRMGRFQAYSNPFAVEKTFGYHIVNSYYAIGSGGINGLGLGKSIEKLGYLPEPHTDFIMAVIAEELGIWGVGFVLILLGYIVLRGIYISMKCKDPFGSMLAIGIAGMIGLQSFINLGGVSGLIPLTGVPLPFVSYGGSSLVQLALASGILVNISMFTNYESKYKKNEMQIDKKTALNNQNVFQLRS